MLIFSEIDVKFYLIFVTLSYLGEEECNFWMVLFWLVKIFSQFCLLAMRLNTWYYKSWLWLLYWQLCSSVFPMRALAKISHRWMRMCSSIMLKLCLTCPEKELKKDSLGLMHCILQWISYKSILRKHHETIIWRSEKN